MDRKNSEKNTRKLVRLGKTSLAVTLPKEIIDDFGWKEKQKVTVKRCGKTIVIKDWKGRAA